MNKILIIDDQIDNIIAITSILDNLMQNIKIFNAESGKKGIEIAQKELPDTILLDIQMPYMDGFETCKIIKSNEKTRHIPIIMLTAFYKDSESKIKCLEIGADAFLSKPVDGSELIAQINAMLRIKKSEERLRNEKELLQELVEERTKELKLAKEQAENSDKLKSIFLANMSHEIRTPMNSIIGFSEILGNRELSEEKKKHFVELIQMSSRQLLGIITDILDISKIDTKQMKMVETEVRLNSLMDRLHKDWMNQKNILKKDRVKLYYSKSLEDESDLIITDKYHLEHILKNLLSNSIKFTEAGHINFGYHVEDGNLFFFVEDTGIGFHEKNKEIIFEKFTQENYKEAARYGGMGLGLPISKGLVELMNGKIWCKSEKGKGSTFYFTIPYKPVCIFQPSEDDTKEKKYDWSEKTILVVEDDIINYNYLEEVLNSTNVCCILARNGIDAIRICNSETKINLILMDIQLPGLDGYKTTKEIKKVNPKIPILAQTAFVTSEDKQRSLEAGCDEHISKPIDVNILYSLIDKHIL